MNDVPAGLILQGTLLLVRQSGPRAAIAIVLLACLGTVVDSGLISDPGAAGVNFLLSALTVAAQYWLTRALLDDLEMTGSLRSRFPAFFFLGIASTIGILFGLVFLVVPGLILIARWSIAGPVLLAQDVGVFTALRRSWFFTAGCSWSIFLSLVAIYLPAFGLAAVAIGIELYLPSPLPATIAANVFLYVGIALGWHSAVAIYSLVGRPQGLAELFA